MHTLRLFASGQLQVSAATAWYLSDLGEFRGRQDLYTLQSPQRLKVLREHALIESAVSSNRIEGVAVEASRIREVLVAPKPLFRDRDEEEVRGYRDALEWIHAEASGIGITEATIKQLHATARGQIWDAGRYKEKDGDIIERYADGQERVRFKTVPAADTLRYVSALISDWESGIAERWAPPAILLAAFNLDFLCIHPFRDGNGRVSRLLWLLQSYRLGYEVGRYISLERLVEQNKERYYATLEQSSKGWHEGKHDPWPFINYVLSIFKLAFREFEDRVGEIGAPRGSKRELVLASIARLTAMPGKGFAISALEQSCPGVSRDMVRRVLREQQAAGTLICQGRGPGAVWKKG
ncbi:MAG: Fic family protein [Burkholderiales bacterium]